MMSNKNITALFLPIVILFSGCTSQPVPPSTLWESKELTGIFSLFTSLDYPDSMDSYYDLDHGHKYAEIFGDIQFQESESNKEYYLMPVNEAKAIFLGNEEPSKNDCNALVDQMTIKKIFGLSEGKYICLLTNEMNFSRVKILEFQDAMVRLEFTTWKD